MNSFIALLRAVNVGGTGKLPMEDLRALCVAAGFRDARTYIASGNVVLRSAGDEAQVKRALETALHGYAGKPVGVLVRSVAEMRQVLAANPFAASPPNRVIAIFLDEAPPADAQAHAKHLGDERIALGRRELYVDYRDADTMRESKLSIPAAKAGTGRNMNTVAKLAEMASG